MASLTKYLNGSGFRMPTWQKSPIFTGTLVGSSIVLLFTAIQDYRRFKALGPGGAPYNVFGWLFVTLGLRPFTLGPQDTTWVGDYNLQNVSVSDGLQDLPRRAGLRARVMGIAPQRQMSQQAPESMRKVSTSWLRCNG
jgi:hypothetical protein